MTQITLFHSSEVGGLVPLDGWYWQSTETEACGPFPSWVEATASAIRDNGNAIEIMGIGGQS